MFFPLFRQLMGGALMAQLSDSLPPEVKKISPGSALKQRAMSSRAVSTAFFRVPTHGIQAGWIAVVLSIIRKHGFHHGLRYRGSG